MSSGSVPAPNEGVLRSISEPLVLFLVIAWSLLGAVGMPVVLLFLRAKAPGFASDWWATVPPVGQAVWVLHSGTCGLCAWLLIRRKQLAVWPAAALAAWHIGVITWQALHGTLSTARLPGARWLGLAATLLVLVAIVWLRGRRVLR